MLEDNPLPAGHVLNPLWNGGVVPPCIGPAAVNAGSLGPVSGVWHHYAGIIAPSIAAHRVGVAVKARFKVLEVFRHMAYCPFIGICAEPVPGLLEGGVMGAEVQAVLIPDERKAVGGGVAGILEVHLAELLGGSHVERPCIHVGYLPNGVLMYLPSGVGCEKPVSFRQLQFPYKRILEFADYSVGLIVLHRCSKPKLPVLFP